MVQLALLGCGSQISHMSHANTISCSGQRSCVTHLEHLVQIGEISYVVVVLGKDL